MEELDDSFLLAASQLFEEQQAIEETKALKRVTHSQVRSGASRFTSPVTTTELQRKVVNAVPQKTKQQTKWAISVWMNWRLHRVKIVKSAEDSSPRLVDMGNTGLC